MSNLYIKGLVSGNVSISGDGGLPSITVGINQTKPVASVDVIGNALFCDTCASFITGGKIQVRIGSEAGRILTGPEMEAVKGGSLFDLNDDGTADQAESTFRAIFDNVDLTSVAESLAILPGDGSKKFLPTKIHVLCLTDDTVTVVAQIRVGTSTGAAEILLTTALTGVDTADLALSLPPVATVF